MDFKEEYVREVEAMKPENEDKIAISSDAYVVGDMIDRLIKKIDQRWKFK